MQRKSHNELVTEALTRALEKWPSALRETEQEFLQKLSDQRLATIYIPSGTPDAFYKEAAKLYGSGGLRYDSADEGGLAGVNPLY